MRYQGPTRGAAGDIDIDVVRRRRDGWAITNRDADPAKRIHYHFAAVVFASTTVAQFAHGLMVRVPKDPDGFLAAVYGDRQVPASKMDFRYGPLNTEVELVTKKPNALGPQLK